MRIPTQRGSFNISSTAGLLNASASGIKREGNFILRLSLSVLNAVLYKFIWLSGIKWLMLASGDESAVAGITVAPGGKALLQDINKRLLVTITASTIARGVAGFLILSITVVFLS